MKKLMILSLILLCAACTSEDDARRALSSAGYTDINILGYSFFSCSKEDFFRTEFTATNYQGKTISGTVCSGLLFKDATIRF